MPIALTAAYGCLLDEPLVVKCDLPPADPVLTGRDWIGLFLPANAPGNEHNSRENRIAWSWIQPAYHGSRTAYQFFDVLSAFTWPVTGRRENDADVRTISGHAFIVRLYRGGTIISKGNRAAEAVLRLVNPVQRISVTVHPGFGLAADVTLEADAAARLTLARNGQRLALAGVPQLNPQLMLRFVDVATGIALCALPVERRSEMAHLPFPRVGDDFRIEIAAATDQHRPAWLRGAPLSSVSVRRGTPTAGIFGLRAALSSDANAGIDSARCGTATLWLPPTHALRPIDIRATCTFVGLIQAGDEVLVMPWLGASLARPLARFPLRREDGTWRQISLPPVTAEPPNNNGRFVLSLVMRYGDFVIEAAHMMVRRGNPSATGAAALQQQRAPSQWDLSTHAKVALLPAATTGGTGADRSATPAYSDFSRGAAVAAAAAAAGPPPQAAAPLAASFTGAGAGAPPPQRPPGMPGPARTHARDEDAAAAAPPPPPPPGLFPAAGAQAAAAAVAAASPSGFAPGSLDEASACVTCMDAPRELMLRPCRHMCLCTACENMLRRKQCPICRTEYSATERVFLV
jgi:hypothetical protein